MAATETHIHENWNINRNGNSDVNSDNGINGNRSMWIPVGMVTWTIIETAANIDSN